MLYHVLWVRRNSDHTIRVGHYGLEVVVHTCYIIQYIKTMIKRGLQKYDESERAQLFSDQYTTITYKEVLYNRGIIYIYI